MKVTLMFCIFWLTILLPIYVQNLQILGIWEIQVLPYCHWVNGLCPVQKEHFSTPAKPRAGWGKRGLSVDMWTTVTQKCEKPVRGGGGVSCCVRVMTVLQQCPGREVAHFSRDNVFSAVVSCTASNALLMLTSPVLRLIGGIGRIFC